MKKSDALVVISVVIISCILVGVGYFFGRAQAETKYISDREVVDDSIPYLLEYPAISLVSEGAIWPNKITADKAIKDQAKFNSKINIAYETDSAIVAHDTVLIKTLPFIASIDTVMNGKDSLNLGYMFPDNIFSIRLNREPDIIQVPMTTVYKTRDRAWWEVPVYIATGIVIGSAVGLGIGIAIGN